MTELHAPRGKGRSSSSRSVIIQEVEFSLGILRLERSGPNPLLPRPHEVSSLSHGAQTQRGLTQSSMTYSLKIKLIAIETPIKKTR